MGATDRAAARVESIFVVVAGAATAAAVLLVTGPHGPGLSGDSATYMSAAQRLADGQGIAAYGGEELVLWPPGFPALLAAIVSIFDVSAVTAGRAANAVLLGSITGVTWLFLRRAVTSATIRVASVSLVAAATSLHMVSSYVWSEPFFALMTLLALLGLNEAIRRPDSAGWLAAAALAASSCFFIRYVGGVVIATGFVAIGVAGWRKFSGRRRARRAAAFAVIASAGPAVWVARNLAVSDTVSGERAPATSIAQNAEDLLRGLGALVAPSAVPGRAVVLLSLCAVALAALLQVRAIGLGGGRQLAWLLAGFVALYVLALVVISSRTQVDDLDDRLLSPIFVPLVVVLAAVLDRAVVGWRKRGRPYWTLLAPGALLLCSAGHAWGTVESGRATAEGLGYAAQRWRDSELAAMVKRSGVPPTVYSNVPDGLFLLTSIDARCWPEELIVGASCSTSFKTELTDLEREVKTEPVAVIFFSPDHSGQRPTTEIPEWLHVTRKTDATDGSIYLLARAPTTR